MRKSFFLIFNLFVSLSALFSAGINLSSKSYTTNEGLGNNFVREIYQDKTGFVWISTLNGLSRYDGHSFVHFQPEFKDSISLLDYHVRNVNEDINNLLWINVSPDYLSCYDLRKEKFVDFTGSGKYKQNYFRRLESADGSNWLLQSGRGCYNIIYKNGKFTSQIHNQSNGILPSNEVHQISEDLSHNIWISCTGGLAKITGKNSKIFTFQGSLIDLISNDKGVFTLSDEGEVFKVDEKNNKLILVCKLNTKTPFKLTTSFISNKDWIIVTPEKAIAINLLSGDINENTLFNLPNAQVIDDKNGNIGIYNNKGVFRYLNQKTGKTKEFQFKFDDITNNLWANMIKDKRGWIWISSNGDGLIIYKEDADEVIHLRYTINSENYFYTNQLTNIMEDKSGGIWISTESAGITHLTILSENIDFIYPEGIKETSNKNHIRLIHQLRDGDICIGNRDGDLYTYDQEMSILKNKTHFPSSIYSLLEVDNGELWYGSRANGIGIKNQWIGKGNNSNTLASEKISLIFEDYRKRKWIGTFNGGLSLLLEYNSKPTFRNYFTEEISLMSIRSIVSDKNDWMWVGTDNGLYVFHPDSLIASSKNFYNYKLSNANRIKYIYKDSKNKMWLGTMGGGVSLCENPFHYNNLNFKNFSSLDGLANNVVQSIIEDESGKIWIATEYGISRFDTKANTFENFFFSQKQLENVYNESSVAKLKNNQLIFGTNHGIIKFDPNAIVSSQINPKLTLTELKINGIAIKPTNEDSPLKQALAFTDKIVLKYFQNSFSIEFSTLEFNTIESKYSYILEGYDQEWSIPSTQNTAIYKKLKPGKYLLKVKASNSAGLWGTNERILSIQIKAPFWATNLAYFIYILLSIVLLFFTYRIILNFYNLQNNLKFERKLTDFKLLFFTNISHEFRTPLTLIKAALEKIQRAEDLENSVQVMSKSTDRLLRLVNQLLEFRKMQSNKLKLQLVEIDVIGFLKKITQHFEDLAIDKTIKFTFSPQEKYKLTYIDKDKMDKIIYNLLSNAFKYTPTNGSIDLSVEFSDKVMLIKVTDSGVGIPKEKQNELFSRFMQTNFSNNSVGIGLHLTQELVSVHLGTIDYKNRENGGSIFSVSIPISKEAYHPDDFSKQIDSIISEDFAGKENIPEIDSEDSNKSNDKKILLIEDDIDINKFLQKELSSQYKVNVAYDGISGYEKAKSFDGDLIVCDVMMPGMDGFELTRKLKSDFETSHIPIILLTAMHTIENQIEGTESGADAYITKPFSTQLLKARIHQIIKQRDLLRSKYSSDAESEISLISSSEIEQKFIEKLNKIIEEHLEDDSFMVENLTYELNLSRTSLFRKVKGVTGYSPNEYMKIYRLKRAVELLKTGNFNVSQVAYKVGISDPQYFSRTFKKQFGVSPSKLIHGDS